MTRVLNSKPVTDAIAEDLAHRVERLHILGIDPTLAIVRRRLGSRRVFLTSMRPYLRKRSFFSCGASMLTLLFMAVWCFARCRLIWKTSLSVMNLL